ncbi:MAG TPA: sodium:solute symporter [Usitatibacter sp.]|nr:sodium:solute symporter [Usitatibacter sp.]
MASFPALFWAFLGVYGTVLYAMAPAARTPEGFFRGRDRAGRDTSRWMLTTSVFIAWIFAKSVTNAANLGEEYGIIGGLAYAAYWLAIPIAGLAIFAIRRSTGAKGLVPFLIGKYGRGAAVGFALAILVRLYNEVWSNTEVVGGYYGAPGSAAFVVAALVFTAAVLFYSMKGGLRSSIFTDVLHAVIFVVFLAVVLFLILPRHSPAELLSQGRFSLATGGDLVLVALLQVLSYPFHDPVLTDRAFITEEKTMLRAFVTAGAAGFAAILLFSLVGVNARLEDIVGNGNVPAAVARSFGVGALFLMTVIMVNAAGSTLDSAFSSLSKAVAVDIPQLLGRTPARGSVPLGTAAMAAVAVLGNIPTFFGADILAATTISGTTVMGLAPVFLLQGFVGRSPWSFHLAFWPGVALAAALTAHAIPASWAIGTGKYALLLGTNFYGLAICTAGFLLPLALTRGRTARAPGR